MKRYRQSTIAIASQEEDDIAWLPPPLLTPDGGHADNDFVSPSVSTGNIARLNGKQSGARRIQIDRSRFVDHSLKQPAWVPSLEPSFKFIGFCGNRDKRGRQTVELRCCLCASNPKAKKANFKG